jgi:AcrR family transcriptional regulator
MMQQRVLPGRQTAKRKLTRAEKVDENRRALFQATAALVGEHGYAGASISRITERAGLAQGTFYLYFESRQHLFDQLLPTVGADLLDRITEAVHGSMDIFEVEERGIRAFFIYLAKNPSFFRILNEAEIAAPEAFEAHFSMLAGRYLSAMNRAVERGQIKDYTLPELEVVIYVLMAARGYIYLKFMRGKRRPKPPPEWVIETYMRFIRYGLHGKR